MKTLKSLQSVHDNFVDTINNLNETLQNDLKVVKKEYQEKILEEKIKLLFNISIGEGLNFETIKQKYLKNKELNHSNKSCNIETKIIEENLLDKIEINGVEYYYENKNKGNIYDINSNNVGIFEEGKFLLKFLL
jgi:hypothetical protein